MAVNSSWNQQPDVGISNAYGSGTISNAINNVNAAFNNINIKNASSTVASIDQLISGLGTSVKNVGSAIRMTSNAIQGVNSGAAPSQKPRTLAIAAEDLTASDASDAGDWRVSLAVPYNLLSSSILAPLKTTKNRMIFPFTPTIQLSHTANYAQIQPTHTNYPFNAYQNSQVDNITVSGDFIVENENDAMYWIAAVHFLRTMTKMFYGNGSYLGQPPMVSHLNGYGKHVLNNVPVLITNFTVDLTADVDYISCSVDGQLNHVPTKSTISVTCAPNYARRSHAKFDLNKFANGEFIGGIDGFI